MKDLFTIKDATLSYGSLGPCISVDLANRLLRERLKVGYMSGSNYYDDAGRGGPEYYIGATHKIYYFIEEIEKVDSAESLLKELFNVKGMEDYGPVMPTGTSWVERTKKLLEGK